MTDFTEDQRDRMKGWHFTDKSRLLRYDDGRKIVIGETLECEGKPRLCQYGLHFSESIIDALQYAPGCIAFRVEGGGAMDIGEDKIAAQSRTALAEYDLTDILPPWARECSLRVIENAKDYFSDDNYQLVVRWLKTGDESIRRDAYRAAYQTVELAPRSAAYYAREAAYSAYSAYCAYCAAISAAISADYSADCSTERKRQESRLMEMITTEYGEIA